MWQYSHDDYSYRAVHLVPLPPPVPPMKMPIILFVNMPIVEIIMMASPVLDVVAVVVELVEMVIVVVML